ncbi:MAG: hypothetical protein EXS13_02615 [Planctomycetes bacterium]|nr:hypothetical protein [Planctomycetota bacterium]
MKRAAMFVFAALCATSSLAGCRREPFRFIVLPVAPSGGLELNAPIVVTFTKPVEPGSVAAGGMRLLAESDGAPIRGAWRVDGTTATFHPLPPCAADLSDAALPAGGRVRVELVGLPRMTALRSSDGVALEEGATVLLSVRARDATTLFIDPMPGAPRLETRPARLIDGRIVLRFSEPLDPRTLAEARFWLHGRWSRESRPTENPLMDARLIANSPVAVVELGGPAQLPMQLVAGARCEVRFEPANGLRDLVGLALADNGKPFYPFVDVEVGVEVDGH